MSKKIKHSNSRKVIIIFAVILVIAILIFLLKLNQNNSSPKEDKNFTITQDNQQLLIDYDKGDVSLFLTGLNNVVKVSEETNLINVELRGVSNKLYLCNNVHNPAITKGGLSNEIIYQEC